MEQLKDIFASNSITIQIIIYIFIFLVVASIIKKLTTLITISLTALLVTQIYFNIPLVAKNNEGIFIKYKQQSITISKENIKVQKYDSKDGTEYFIIDQNNPKLQLKFAIKDNMIASIFEFILKKYKVEISSVKLRE